SGRLWEGYRLSAGDRRPRHGAKYFGAVSGAEQRLTRAVGMRHHAQHVASFIADAGDIIEGAVSMRVRRDAPIGLGIAENYPVLTFQRLQGLRVTIVIAFHVADGNTQH